MARLAADRGATFDSSSYSEQPTGLPQASARYIPPAPRALLIQADSRDAETFMHALRSMRVKSSWARTGVDGLAALEVARYDVVFVDRELPDLSAVALMQALRASDQRTRCFIVSSVVSMAVAREALHLGALGVLGKPFETSDVIAAVYSALGTPSSRQHGGPAVNDAATPAPEHSASEVRTTPRSVAERWAVLMLNVIHADEDPKTIARWARAVGVSRSALCECCRLIRVSPHDARDFARLMRAIYRSGPIWQPETFLDLADARTLKKLLERAGLTDRVTQTPTLADFLDRQRWISSSNPGLLALRTLLDGGEDSHAVTTPRGAEHGYVPHDGVLDWLGRTRPRAGQSPKR